MINPELSSNIQEPVKIRDESLRRTQDNLAIAAWALGKVISGLISGDTEIDKMALLADLSDTSRYKVGTQY